MVVGVTALFSRTVDNRFEQPGLVVNYFREFTQTYLRSGFLEQRVGNGGRSVFAFLRHAMRPPDQKFRL